MARHSGSASLRSNAHGCGVSREDVKAVGTGGFTLIELLLVLLIIGVVSAITMPAFINSMRGNRLRAASRAVVSAGRYARSMAVLKQQDMAVIFDLDGGKITIHAVETRKVVPGEEEYLRDGSRRRAGESRAALRDQERISGSAGDADGDGEPVALTGDGDEASYVLDSVAIESVDISGEQKRTDGRGTVIYRTNGRCKPYTVELIDRNDEKVTIEVDALATASTGGGR